MSNRNKTMIGTILIIIAGCFWGSMGIFVRKLGTYGFSSIQIVSIRVTLAAMIFALVLFIKDRKGFRISLKDIPLFLGLGFGSILFFTVCYFTAISMMSLSTAAILLYTSPIWIMLMSILFFHEKPDRRKMTALVLAFAGCVLVSGISGEGTTLAGLLVGLGSGIGYGLYSILGKIALRRYSPPTGSGVASIMPAISKALLFTHVACPQLRLRQTGLSGDTESSSSFVGNAGSLHSSLIQPRPTIHSPGRAFLPTTDSPRKRQAVRRTRMKPPCRPLRISNGICWPWKRKKACTPTKPPRRTAFVLIT